jgi:hypothetical protein
MHTLQSPQTQEKHRRALEKLLSQHRYTEVDALIREHNRLLAYTEHIPCSEVTKHMTEADHLESNRLLRKICILSDILEGAGIDLLNVINRYDRYVSLPLVGQLKHLHTMAGRVRQLIDDVKNEEYSITFGETCDEINQAIDDNIVRLFQREMQIVKQNNDLPSVDVSINTLEQKKYKPHPHDYPYWDDDLLGCPDQCYCYFNTPGNRYYIYLRWIYSDPWTAQIVPVDSGTNEWIDISTPFFSRDQLMDLKHFCEEYVRERYHNIKWM